MSERALPDLPRIYETYHGKVLAYVTSLLGRDAADDVTQEVFIKVGRSLSTLEDPAKLASWLYAITLNTVRDAARKRSSAARSLSPEHAGTEAELESDLSRMPDSVARTPEEAAIRKEMVACYLDYVKQLARSHYEVYVLSEFDHLSNAEIARRLSLSIGTVKIRLHRARARLREELRRNCRCYYNERGELMGEPRQATLPTSGSPTAAQESSSRRTRKP